MTTTLPQELRDSVSKTGPWNYAWSELRLRAAAELEALQNKTTELKAFCDDVEGLLQAERNKNQELREALPALIEAFDSVEAILILDHSVNSLRIARAKDACQSMKSIVNKALALKPEVQVGTHVFYLTEDGIKTVERREESK